jgi:hypothetical protein
MHIAAYMGSRDVLNVLLESRAGATGEAVDYDCCTEGGQTLLHAAVEGDQVEVCAFLIEAGANPDLQSNNGESPLHVACQLSHSNCVYTLVRYENVTLNLRTSQGFTPYELATSQDVRRALVAAAISVAESEGRDPDEDTILEMLVRDARLNLHREETAATVADYRAASSLAMREAEEDSDQGNHHHHLNASFEDDEGIETIVLPERGTGSLGRVPLGVIEAEEAIPIDDDDLTAPSPWTSRLTQKLGSDDLAVAAGVAGLTSSSAGGPPLVVSLTEAVLEALSTMERKEYHPVQRFSNPAQRAGRSHHGYDLPDVEVTDEVVEGGRIPAVRPDTAYSNSTKYETPRGSRPTSATSNISAYFYQESTRPSSASSQRSDYQYLMNAPTTGQGGPRITPDPGEGGPKAAVPSPGHGLVKPSIPVPFPKKKT